MCTVKHSAIEDMLDDIRCSLDVLFDEAPGDPAKALKDANRMLCKLEWKWFLPKEVRRQVRHLRFSWRQLKHTIKS